MCDTLVFFSKVETERSFFAKNSDRDPGEPQIIEIITDAREDFETDILTEHLPKYHRQLQSHKEVFPNFRHPYSAIISRPTWIWGAEMGNWAQFMEVEDKMKISRLYHFYEENGTLLKTARYINLCDPQDHVPQPIDQY